MNNREGNCRINGHLIAQIIWCWLSEICVSGTWRGDGDKSRDYKGAKRSVSKANKVTGGYIKCKGNLKAAVPGAKNITSIGKMLPSMYPNGRGKGYGRKTAPSQPSGRTGLRYGK